jgi:8-hydroxy-5-deazaflavin:NADPH oxidoreductase
MPAPIAIIGGTGALGFGLAQRWDRAGVPVVIGTRPGEHPPAPGLEALPYGAAAEHAEIVVLCVPFRSQSETLTNLRGHLRRGQLLIDTTVPLAAAVSGKATRTLGVWQGSAAQQAEEMAPPGVRVVAALHTVSAARLRDPDRRLAEDVLVCGDDDGAKRDAIALIERIPGLRGVDAGGLEHARIAEQLKALLIGIDARYRTQAGLRIAGLP